MGGEGMSSRCSWDPVVFIFAWTGPPVLEVLLFSFGESVARSSPSVLWLMILMRSDGIFCCAGCLN